MVHTDATEQDPTLAAGWSELARIELAVGPGGPVERLEGARAAYQRALEESPWSRTALEGLRRVDLALGRDDDAARWADRLCRIDACPPE